MNGGDTLQSNVNLLNATDYTLKMVKMVTLMSY